MIRIGKSKKRLAPTVNVRIITLCGNCADDYRSAGYPLRPDYSNKIRSECDKCFVRMGFDYYIGELPTIKQR